MERIIGSKTENIKQTLPYAVIPLICASLFIVKRGGTDAFTLLNFEVLAVIGYVAAVTDLRTKRIPNRLVLIMLISWAVLMVPKLYLDSDAAVASFINAALGFAIGGGMFLLVYIASSKGLGGGDVKFIAAAGLYLGFGGTISTVLFGSILAGMTGTVLIMLRKIGRKDTMPLAPFLYIGILITLFMQ